MEIELKYKGWQSVPLKVYDEIVKAINENKEDALQRNISLLAILCDSTEDEILNLSIDEVSRLMNQTEWIGNFDFPKEINLKKIKIGDTDCRICPKLQEYTVAQYIDFQMFIKDLDRRKANIMATIIIPEGHKYGEGYDLDEFTQKINENLTIVAYNSLFFSLHHYWQSLTKQSLVSSKKILLEQMEKEENETLKQQMKETVQQMDSLIGTN